MSEEAGGDDNAPFPWKVGIYDAHCHPTDTMAMVDEIPAMRARVLTIMATRLQDQELVSKVNDKLGLAPGRTDFDGDCQAAPCEVIPAFGWHPWFSHQLYDDRLRHAAAAPSKSEHYREVVTPSPDDEAFIAALPEPRPLSVYLQQTREALARCPLAMVGEIGLDRSFRIPEFGDPSRLREVEPGLTPGGREGRRLSPYKVDMQHQKLILKAQLELAGQTRRAVSVHGVAAHGALFETLQETWRGHERKVLSSRERKRRASADRAHASDEDDEPPPLGPLPYPPRICLHSYSGPPDTVKQYTQASIPATIFFSFSQAINMGSAAAGKAVEVIRALPDDRILIESDLHRAGPQMDEMLKAIVRVVCKEKKWDLEQGARQLAANWRHFALGQE